MIERMMKNNHHIINDQTQNGRDIMSQEQPYRLIKYSKCGNNT